jgi:hypothetical protein
MSARTRRIVTDRPAKVRLVDETERPAGRRPEPELSVVTCSVGRAAVRETVASVAASASSAAQEVEIVVVWQGSDDPPDLDGTAAVTAVFPAGLSYARNRGLAAAQAPLVAFVDDDEVVDTAWIGAILEAFDRVPVSAVFGPVAPRDDRGLPYCRYDGGGELRVVSGERALPWTVGTGGNMAFRRDDLVELGGFDIVFGLGSVARSAEDTELILRLLRAGRSVAWSPDVVVYHPSKTAGERLASRFLPPTGSGSWRAATATRCWLRATARRSSRTPAVRSGRETPGACARRGRRCSGFSPASGCGARPRSPEQVLARAPGAIRSALGSDPVEALVPLFRPEPITCTALEWIACCTSTSSRRLVSAKASLRVSESAGSPSSADPAPAGLGRVERLALGARRPPGRRGAEAGRRWPLVRRGRPLGARARRAGRPAGA